MLVEEQGGRKLNAHKELRRKGHVSNVSGIIGFGAILDTEDRIAREAPPQRGSEGEAVLTKSPRQAKLCDSFSSFLF